MRGEQNKTPAIRSAYSLRPKPATSNPPLYPAINPTLPRRFNYEASCAGARSKSSAAINALKGEGNVSFLPENFFPSDVEEEEEERRAGRVGQLNPILAY